MGRQGEQRSGPTHPELPCSGAIYELGRNQPRELLWGTGWEVLGMWRRECTLVLAPATPACPASPAPPPSPQGARVLQPVTRANAANCFLHWPTGGNEGRPAMILLAI